MINHHPTEDILLDYAVGALGEAKSIAVAAHCELCDACAKSVRTLEAAGGVLLESIDGVDVSEDALASVLARLDEPIALPSRQSAIDAETRRLLPKVLLRYVGGNLSDLPWRRIGRVYEEFRLPLALKSARASLMRVKPGTLMPRHGHRGHEWTVVLVGGFHDEGIGFGRGDFNAKDSSHCHQPQVDDDGECICLVVLDAPLKLTGALGILVNPFLRI